MGTKKRLEHGWIVALAALWALAFPIAVGAAPLTIDGAFDDWEGQPYIDDAAGDGPTPNTDIVGFYWGTNANDDHLYWMIERRRTTSGNLRVYFWVHVDANNNGDYADAADRVVRVFYDPAKNSSEVIVTVFGGTGAQIAEYGGDWGESRKEGQSRAEWRVSFEHLGIDAHQTINMYAGASSNANATHIDRAPDDGDITWTPIPILGWPALAAVVIGTAVVAWFTQGRKRWRGSPSMR